MFERTWQLRRIYGKVVNDGKLTTKVTGIFEIGGGIAILTAIQFIILLIWQFVDPFKSKLIQTHVIEFQVTPA